MYLENVDKKFAAWAALIILGPACVITYALSSQGMNPPPLSFILEHAALGVAIRTTYKSFDGFDWFYKILDFVGIMGGETVEAPADALAEAA